MFKSNDKRIRGTGHAGWEKATVQSKYTRAQATVAISNVAASILDDTKSELDHHMQLRDRSRCDKHEAVVTHAMEGNTYRLLHINKTCDMFNSAYRQHREESPDCPTYLKFDFQQERQKGVCWKETLRCESCGFQSERNKLYEELTTPNRGAKTAKPNIGLWVALMDNPIMGTTLQEIFMALNTPAPSYSGLQYTANKVGPMLVQMVREDLRKQRTHLKDVLESYGLPRTTPIPVEGDGRYNNPLYWSRDKNPFQPATQSTYTVVENLTNEKKIIGTVTKNKLCHKRKRGEKCPDHSGKCTATIALDAPIGREDQLTEEICQEFLADPEPTTISHITTDGDSAAYRGVQKIMRDQGQEVEALRDTRHLAQSQKKAIDAAKFSDTMFPGRTASQRLSVKRKFSVDLMKRCSAEYDQAVKNFRGNTERLVNCLSFATDAIIECYASKCGETCAKHSLVCKGLEPDQCWPKEYLPPNARKLQLTEDDEHTLRRLIDYRFNRKMLFSTRFGTNTQKCEAMHRGFSKSNPKNVTCSANFSPKIFSAIHRMNHGPGKSTAMKCAALGAPITDDTRVTRQLKKKTGNL